MEREATLVPCHHPKTELLQNILKCFRVTEYKCMRRISCGSSSSEQKKAERISEGQIRDEPDREGQQERYK